MSPLERRAAFKAAIVLRQTTVTQATQELGVSYNHLALVLKGERKGSQQLESRIAAFIGCSREEVFAPASEIARHT